jgi:Regulator of ribonuclease activity B
MNLTPGDDTNAALMKYEADGSDLTKPMEIDFFVAVFSEEKGNLVSSEAQALGFRTNVELDIETSEWTCYCTKTLIPEYSEVVRIEQQLDDLARPHGGYIDGFGSYGNAV